MCPLAEILHHGTTGFVLKAETDLFSESETKIGFLELFLKETKNWHMNVIEDIVIIIILFIFFLLSSYLRKAAGALVCSSMSTHLACSDKVGAKRQLDALPNCCNSTSHTHPTPPLPSQFTLAWDWLWECQWLGVIQHTHMICKRCLSL